MGEQKARTAAALFDDLAATPTDHFRLYFFGAVFVCIEHATDCAESLDAAIERFPFLLGYYNELAERLAGLSTHEAFGHWCRGIEIWEERAPGHLPLRALRTALQLNLAEAICLVTVGLVEEDARFGALFDALQGTNQRRPTVSFLKQCWRQYLSQEAFSLLLRRCRRFGFLHTLNSEVPYQDLALRILPPVWEALRGDEFGGPIKWAHYHEPEALLPVGDLILPQETRAALEVLPGMIESGEARVIVVRGPLHNGRRTALGTVARATGRGLLEVRGVEKVDDERWCQAATLGLLRHALPVAGFDLAPGETLSLPDDWPSGVPLGIVLGRHGGLSGRLASEVVTLMLDLPDVASRAAHWRRSLTAAIAPDQILEISSRFRFAAGHIHRTARLAKMRASLGGHRELTHADVLSATRTLNHQALDGLARRVPAHGDWSQLCASERTHRELRHLESRCRHRERLSAVLGNTPGGLSYGVCALFSGPSGTGKTLAAGLLAAALEKDIYRLDLSAVVNKYIGETEKNLNRALEHAEELDVILLLDEGDALLGRRTDVHNANDRYANLETNFLLQRLESFQGVLIVTTNAPNRIDSAFERRMDVIVEFSFPTAEERWHLWRAHLPPSGRCDEQILAQIASRCELSGGQIRNAVLHACLLALENGGVVTTANVEAAARREYLKQGAACPLRHSSLSA
jgi:hypothetical protein